MQNAFGTNSSFQIAIDGLLHRSCKKDDEDRARHRLFTGVHLLAGLAALALLPIVILVAGSGETSANSALSLLPVWMLAPLMSVAYLSKTGKLANAFLLTATLTAAFIVWIACHTGGLASPHLIWLGVIPLEVILSANRTIIKQAVLICLAAVACVAVFSVTGWSHAWALTPDAISAIGSVSIMAAILYASILALRIEALHRHRLDAFQQKEMRYRSLANTVSDMITRHDRSGDVLFVSPSSNALLGIAPADLLGNHLFHQVHIPDRPAYLKALSDCMTANAPLAEAVSVEVRMMACTKGQGELSNAPQEAEQLRWVELICTPELNENGTVIGAIAATRDISKRKQHQKAQEEARAEAERANESKTRFLANVTHELRTPLNTIIGFSEILCHPEFSSQNEERNREYAQLIHKGGNHLLQLVNALLDMSRIESGNFDVSPQLFDIKDLVQSCCKMMQSEADRRKVVLFSRQDDDLQDINADPRACRQILLNLISNALKFSDTSGQVCVSLAWATTKAGATDKQRIIMSVRDTGIGIAQADIPKLGRPFVQAESSLQRRYEGAGIGLSIVRGLAELQHGSMTIKSELGKGTTVTITLPLDMEAVTNEKDTNEPQTLVSIKGTSEGAGAEETPDQESAHRVA